MPPMPIPPRTTILDPDAAPIATRDPERPWWEPIAEWPTDMHFDDVGADVLAAERQLDSGKLAPPPPPPGAFSCTARACVESPLAEIDLAGPLPRRAEVMRRSRRHPLDRPA